MDLRVVLFGGKFSGKTSVINAVFGNKLFDTQKRTAKCIKHQRNVGGRNLTLVDTPGWWKHFPLSDTATFLKHELIHGVSLCQPGPHAILLVIEIDIPFTEKHRKAAEDHLELLGGEIWTHALVLFTRCLHLENKTIEEHIENEGEALQWLIQKCGNRYHVFNSAVLNDVSQVTQLLEKIEDIVQRNNGACFQTEASILEKTSDWKENVTTKAKSRELKLQEQMRNLNKQELRIMLLGWAIAGKSSAGNTILNKNAFLTGQSTVKCQNANGEVAGRAVSVLDTPSWFKYFPSQYTPVWRKSEICKALSQSLHCILLVIPADTSFKEEQKKVIQEQMSFLGEQVWRHTVVLFTWGDILGDMTIEQHIESEGEALQWVIEKCENKYHVFNNVERQNSEQVKGLLEKIEAMVLRSGLFQCSADTVNRIHPKQDEVDTLTDSGAESDLQDVVQLVDEEWRRREKELIQKVSQIIPQRGDRSMEFPPDFDMSSTTETEESYQTESQPCRTVQSEEKNTLKLKDQVKEMLDLEWNRREEAVMGRLLEMLSELRCETQSEPSDFEKEKSRQKVSPWLEDCSNGHTSASSGYLDSP